MNRFASCCGQDKWVCRDRIGVSTACWRSTIGGDVGCDRAGDTFESTVADVRLGGCVAGLLVAGRGWCGGVSLCWRLEPTVLYLWRSGHISTGVLRPPIWERGWSVGGADNDWSWGGGWRFVGGGHHWSSWNTIRLQWSSSWNTIGLQWLIIVILVIIDVRFLISLRQTIIK